MIATFGLPLVQLQGLVIVGITILVVGYILFTFWQHIAFGIAGLACVYILCAKENIDVNKVETPIVKQQVVPEQTEEKGMFMEDCQSVTDYSKSKCENIWEERQEQEAELTNANFKVKKDSIKRNL